MEPKVSVIVPVYKAEKFLRQCMDSLVNQTLEEIEIIAVNDRSPDNSIKILNEYKEAYPEKVIVINSKKNRGPGGARNLGLESARGEYIGFVDSDDYVKPDMYKKLYKISKRADYDITDSAFYNEKSKKKSITTPKEAIGELDDKKIGILIMNMGFLWTKLIKRSIFANNGITFRENVAYSDTDVLPDIFIHSKKLGFTNELFYIYNENTNSVTNNFNPKSFIYDKIASVYATAERLKKAGCMEKYNEIFTFRLYKVYSNILYHIMFRNYTPTLELFTYLRDFFFELQHDYKNNSYIKTLDRVYIKIAEINNESPKKALACRSDIISLKF